MSIVNAFVSPECGVVCADTEAGPDGGPYIEVSKLVPLPHLGAVIAFRGSLLFLAGAANAAFALACSFDELSQHMPDLLQRSSDNAVKMLPRVGLSDKMTSEDAGCGEAILIGFSPAAGRIVGHHYRRITLDGGFVTNARARYFSAPAWSDIDFDLPAISANVTKENMKALALEQSRLARERDTTGEATGGGRLIYAEVRRDSMTIETVMDFPARPAVSKEAT